MNPSSSVPEACLATAAYRSNEDILMNIGNLDWSNIQIHENSMCDGNGLLSSPDARWENWMTTQNLPEMDSISKVPHGLPPVESPTGAKIEGSDSRANTSMRRLNMDTDKSERSSDDSKFPTKSKKPYCPASPNSEPFDTPRFLGEYMVPIFKGNNMQADQFEREPGGVEDVTVPRFLSEIDIDRHATYPEANNAYLACYGNASLKCGLELPIPHLKDENPSNEFFCRPPAITHYSTKSAMESQLFRDNYELESQGMAAPPTPCNNTSTESALRSKAHLNYTAVESREENWPRKTGTATGEQRDIEGDEGKPIMMYVNDWNQRY